ncbi:unnamed protein product (macronuclear) [Paramecium tetraurelia]|uniref:Transmembrane protein n=1 Tax=Paramecium tetraurelia TaxID=5888 RepID=A0BQM9_PARTE|nr:uncharacterized protein GSPATT00031075001 [Paramecium tetraurelia]CAK60846.1 unnamed protein product [Paramecium tetraurelia]|eukprot:XP_001428244.1 hypothetical protein (macronuclear) [Paramecium tetraurelia strain d4-2]
MIYYRYFSINKHPLTIQVFPLLFQLKFSQLVPLRCLHKYFFYIIIYLDVEITKELIYSSNFKRTSFYNKMFQVSLQIDGLQKETQMSQPQDYHLKMFREPLNLMKIFFLQGELASILSLLVCNKVILDSINKLIAVSNPVSQLFFLYPKQQVKLILYEILLWLYEDKCCLSKSIDLFNYQFKQPQHYCFTQKQIKLWKYLQQFCQQFILN